LVRQVDLKDYLPPIMQEVAEIREVMDTETEEVNELYQRIEDNLNDQFVVSASVNGIQRYERMLKIKPPAGEDIETRRNRILLRFQEQLPYTRIVLRRILESVLGGDNHEFVVDSGAKTMFFALEMDAPGKDRLVQYVEELLERLTPQNLALTVAHRITSQLSIGTVMVSGETITVYPWTVTELTSQGTAYIPIAHNTGVEITTIYPKEE